MGIRRPKSNKNPPILSHEFIIQNHADIVSCIAMIFVIGLMFQASTPISSLFVGMQHNTTINETDPVTSEQYEVVMYTYGLKDFFTAFFYFLICIVVHAVIQEYILDKMNRKMHLSKVKHSKFNESGQLIAFYVASVVWGADIIFRENYLTNINSLWEEYPHAILPFIIKFYFLIQMSYWLHNFPELYFQKVKKEEMAARIEYSALYFVFITAAYTLNFTRVALCLMVLHYTVELVFHLSRALYFSEKNDLANTGFMVWNVLFVLIRLGTITLAVLTFWYGLEKSGVAAINSAEGNFNTQLVRGLCLFAVCPLQAYMMCNLITFHLKGLCLFAVCLLQAYMMWNFITFHLKRLREKKESATSQRRIVSQGSVKSKKDKKKDDSSNSTVTENGSVRRKSPKAKKNQ